jgi:hypothetical protein
MSMWSSRVCAILVGLLAVALAGCGGSDRTATANNSSQVSGQSVAAALQTQLAKEGVSGAQVSCAKTIIVNVGPKVSCTVSSGGAGATAAAASGTAGASPRGAGKTVTFTFKTLDGKIDLSSVKAS